MKSSLSLASARIVYVVALALAASTLSFAASGTWSSTGTMISARDGHTATILTNGKILAAGGTNNGVALTSAELYNPCGRDLGVHRKHAHGAQPCSRHTASQWIGSDHRWLR